MKDYIPGLDDMFAEDLKDPEFRKLYRKQKPYFDLVVEMINRRIDLGLTQEDLAERIGSYQSRISTIESGEHDFRLSTIIEIAEALGTQLSINLIPIEQTVESEIEANFLESVSYGAEEDEQDTWGTEYEAVESVNATGHSQINDRKDPLEDVDEGKEMVRV